MDRAHNIESQWVNDDYFNRQMKEYVGVQYMANVRNGKPQRNGFSWVHNNIRWQPSLRPLNIKRSRYHAPGGMEYNAQDFAQILDSRQLAEVANQEIKVNPGLIGQTV